MKREESFKEVVSKYKTICSGMLNCDECPIKKASILNCKNYMVNKPDEFIETVDRVFKELYSKEETKTKRFSIKALFNRK